MTKKIAVYGSYETKVPVRQRYWKRGRDGIKQRYCSRRQPLKQPAPILVDIEQA